MKSMMHHSFHRAPASLKPFGMAGSFVNHIKIRHPSTNNCKGCRISSSYYFKFNSDISAVFLDLYTIRADYFTAPVIPSANCFCNTKNTIIVGTEQNNTPNIKRP